MRILVDVPEDQIRLLAELAARFNRRRAALVREAIAAYLANHQLTPAANAFGLWRNVAADGLTYQKKARAAW